MTITAKSGASQPAMKAASASYKSARLTWNKVSGANGYSIYRAASRNGTYKYIAGITKGGTVSYTDSKNLTIGKTYYYKIRAYRTVSGKNIYGAASAAKAVKAK